MSNVDAKVCDVIAAQLRRPREQVLPTAQLGGDLEADSLDIVEVVMALEAEFNLELISKQARVETVQDVIDYIKAAIKNRDTERASESAPAVQAGE